MAAKALLAPLNQTLRVVTALAGTFPLAVLASFCLGKYQPFGPDIGLLLGYLALIPLWVGSICLFYSFSSGLKALAYCGSASLFFGLLMQV
jgi:hypothetical protein